ncbi:unnamed protein product [Gemmata massiliana]|uniref:Uncharacterized protein n=1 Tax=Gemmata massiliana TaxID=1210884 RepID=A0A6P2DBI0_9BACT|nr:hypothetical protein [Gemmata massiliana]VTR97604.1 unnamed protein product [Gemmata massiliana]
MNKVSEKYEKRTIVIKGMVAAVKGDPHVPIIKFVELKGDDQTVVKCRFGSSDQESKLPDKYKAGDAAIFVGELTRVEKGRFVVGPCYPAQSSDPPGKK